MDTQLLQHISNKLNEEVEIMTNDLALGKAKDHGEYKWACGIVRGLSMANGILADTVQQAEQDDDE